VTTPKVEPKVEQWMEAAAREIVYFIYPGAKEHPESEQEVIVYAEIIARHAAPALKRNAALHETITEKDTEIARLQVLRGLAGFGLGVAQEEIARLRKATTASYPELFSALMATEEALMNAQTEIAVLKDYSDRWPGNMEDKYQAMQEENEWLREVFGKAATVCMELGDNPDPTDQFKELTELRTAVAKVKIARVKEATDGTR